MSDKVFIRGVWVVVAVLELRLVDAALTTNQWREFGLSSLVILITAVALSYLLRQRA